MVHVRIQTSELLTLSSIFADLADRTLISVIRTIRARRGKLRGLCDLRVRIPSQLQSSVFARSYICCIAPKPTV